MTADIYTLTLIIQLSCCKSFEDDYTKWNVGLDIHVILIIWSIIISLATKMPFTSLESIIQVLSSVGNEQSWKKKYHSPW